MKIIAQLLIIMFFFKGCLYLNERGVSANYYSECKEYYDSEGFYHKSCDENLFDYKDVPEKIKKTKESIMPEHGVREFKFGF